MLHRSVSLVILFLFLCVRTSLIGHAQTPLSFSRTLICVHLQGILQKPGALCMADVKFPRVITSGRLRSRRSGQREESPPPRMIVGIASDCKQPDRDLNRLWKMLPGHFGFIQAIGYKCNGKGTEVYASPYNAGDAVSVVLDMTTKTLSFKKNGQNLGIAYSNLPHSTYRLVVSFYGLGQKVKLAS
mmetsp:Transcript_87390/g.173431  ORF Transcript_87390/g.173431 Transcript_87390/m.173431 type:complete len:186 (+) Transcript_87390:1121-1678(+)